MPDLSSKSAQEKTAAPCPENEYAAARRKSRRRIILYTLLLVAWLLVGVGLFQHMWENRHTTDEDGNSVLWPKYNRDEEEE